jgi:hypothetical protein
MPPSSSTCTTNATNWTRERPADVLIGNQEGGVSNRGTALLGKRDA